MFLGTTFLGGNDTISPTITNVDNMTYVNITGCILDELYASYDMNTEQTTTFPTEWTYDTILHGTYDKTLDAGNVDYNVDNTSYIAIKRREKGDFDWNTIYVKQINTVDDFNISETDRTTRSNVIYQYAVVPYTNSGAGNYNVSKDVESKFDGIYIVSADKMYGTIIEPGSIDTTRNVPSNVVELLHNKYPKYVSNGKANYDTGSASGIFVPLKDCQLDVYAGTEYRKDIIDFLSDRRPKLLKYFDGRIWLINVTGEITDSIANIWQLRNISFNWTEVGNCNSEKDMYRSGLSNVTSEWW